MANFREYGFGEVLLKPYTMEEISTKLSALLGELKGGGDSKFVDSLNREAASG
jgi:hypothetical protein